MKMIGYEAAYLLRLVQRLSGGGEKESLVSTVSISCTKALRGWGEREPGIHC